jgi:circadian clock protein KaiC
MDESKRVTLRTLSSGVPGLDEILGGGVPEFSFNLIAGAPGGGKTTLAQQIMFRNATDERGGLYFTVLGEPPVKMMRYQQLYSFFDADKVGRSIRFVNLGREVTEGNLDAVLQRIIREVEMREPEIVVVDSFRTLVRPTPGSEHLQGDVQSFTQRLAMHLTTWSVTSFLVGEYVPEDRETNPVFTIADGILWLSQALDRNSVVRKLQVVKGRGQAHMPGLHNFRITSDGIRVFPRISMPRPEEDRVAMKGRVSTGNADLDEMMGGGVPAGDSVLVAGPSGSGKSVLATQFVTIGMEEGEAAVLIVFEEHPKEYLARAEALGFGVQDRIERGQLEVIYLRPLDLSPDETLYELREAVKRMKATRVVIDSLSGFELALAPTFRAEFRESLYRLIGALTGSGVTVLTTMEVVQEENALRFTNNVISFLADDLLLLRYVEMDGALRKVVTVGKMRGSGHSKHFRLYDVTDRGILLHGSVEGYDGRISGAPGLIPPGG